MSSTQQRQAMAREARRAANRAAKVGQPKPYVPGKGFKPITLGAGFNTMFGGSTGSMMFTVEDELAKMREITKDDAGSLRANDEDFTKLPYGRLDAGFFIAQIGGNGSANSIGFKESGLNGREPSLALLDELELKQQIRGGKMVLSTYCSFDRVKAHMDAVLKLLKVDFIGFSTPKALNILAEKC